MKDDSFKMIEQHLIAATEQTLPEVIFQVNALHLTPYRSRCLQTLPEAAKHLGVAEM